MTTARPDGWVTLPLPGGGLHVRVRRRDDDRVVVTDLYIHAPEITSATLRQISMARIEAAVNVRGRPGLQAALAGLGEQAGLDTTPLFPADAASDDVPEPSLADLRQRTPTRPGKPKKARRKPLTRPGRLPDPDFYQRVAHAYQALVPETRSPAVAIAEEADVPVPTVHRWILEARRRGHLPPASKGRAG